MEILVAKTAGFCFGVKKQLKRPIPKMGKEYSLMVQ